MEILQNDFDEDDVSENLESPVAKKVTKIKDTITDTSPVEAFLQGKHCLTGVSGFFEGSRKGLIGEYLGLVVGNWLVEV